VTANERQLIDAANAYANERNRELHEAAREVVRARYACGEWDVLKGAIGRLEDLVGRPE